MSRRKWRGFATFDMPLGSKEALMTVCPGNPEQEGSRFESIMQAAGAKLDKLYIIQASELGYHNLKRLVPKGDARSFAIYRGIKWQEDHQDFINQYMGKRCEVIPMSDIVSETDHDMRTNLIREIYDRGDNPVTEWFDYSADLDISTRVSRKSKDGITIEPWAIKENSLDYLCEEYSMRSIMWHKFSLEEIYLGLAVTDSNLFQDQNLSPEIDLTIPKVRAITLQNVEMIHDRKLGRAFPSNDSISIPEYAPIFKG